MLTGLIFCGYSADLGSSIPGLLRGGRLLISIDPKRTAIVAVHLQNNAIGASAPPFMRPELDRTDVLTSVVRVLEAARAAGVKVVFTRIAYQPGYPNLVANTPAYKMARETNAFLDGTPGAAIVDEAKAQDGDHVVTHQRTSGFHNTELDLLLRGLDINTVAFVGVQTSLSVEGTARQASDLGYRTLIVSDACASHSEAAHDGALVTLSMLAEVVTSAELLAAMTATAAEGNA